MTWAVASMWTAGFALSEILDAPPEILGAAQRQQAARRRSSGPSSDGSLGDLGRWIPTEDS